MSPNFLRNEQRENLHRFYSNPGDFHGFSQLSSQGFFFSIRASPQSNVWYRVMPISIHQSEANPSQKTHSPKKGSRPQAHIEKHMSQPMKHMLKTHQLNLSRSWTKPSSLKTLLANWSFRCRLRIRQISWWPFLWTNSWQLSWSSTSSHKASRDFSRTWGSGDEWKPYDFPAVLMGIFHDFP